MISRLLTWARSLFGGQELPPLAQITLVDVRSPQEFGSGHLANALGLPLDQLQHLAIARLPDRNAPIVVYCQSGMRSAMAKKILVRMGYRHVINGGGISRLARRLSQQ